MKCKHCRYQLEEWLDGGLTVDERAALEGHLDSCPACGQYLARRRALGAALKKSLRELGADLHFQPQAVSRSGRPLGGPAVSMSGPIGKPVRPRPWFVLTPRLGVALAAGTLIALLFLFPPWAQRRPDAASRAVPTAEITVSDSLNITDAAYISGCSAGVCYSIELQVTAVRINDPT